MGKANYLRHEHVRAVDRELLGNKQDYDGVTTNDTVAMVKKRLGITLTVSQARTALEAAGIRYRKQSFKTVNTKRQLEIVCVILALSDLRFALRSIADAGGSNPVLEHYLESADSHLDRLTGEWLPEQAHGNGNGNGERMLIEK